MRDKHTDSNRIKVYYMYLTYMHLLYSPHIQSSRYQAAGGNSLQCYCVGWFLTSNAAPVLAATGLSRWGPTIQVFHCSNKHRGKDTCSPKPKTKEGEVRVLSRKALPLLAKVTIDHSEIYYVFAPCQNLWHELYLIGGADAKSTRVCESSRDDLMLSLNISNLISQSNLIWPRI